MKKKGVDYTDPKVRKEVLVRQRRGMWTPEQITSFTDHFKIKSGMRLLDAGCGYGYSLRTYGPRCLPGGRLVGLDVEHGLLKTARKLAGKEGLGSRSHFINATMYRLPFPDNTFDVSMAQVVFCHLDRPQKALDEMIRVTKRDGCIAVFDNAVGSGGSAGWTSLIKPTIASEVFGFEMTLRMMKGKTRRGEGDFSVGCYVPAWMEKRGLKNVDARCNEKVQWMAPPYRSPAQKILVDYWKARRKDRKSDSATYLDFKIRLKQMRAGGASAAKIKRYLRRNKKRGLLWMKAMGRKRLAMAFSHGGFWCVWGFKP